MRRTPTHELFSGTTKGSSVIWMSEFPEEIPVILSHGINELGKARNAGDINTSYRIYRIPEGSGQDNRIDPKEWIQTAERLTAEVKRREDDGVLRQYVIGRPNAAGEPEESPS